MADSLCPMKGGLRNFAGASGELEGDLGTFWDLGTFDEASGELEGDLEALGDFAEVSDCLRPFPGSFALASGELGGDLETLCDSFVVFDSFCSSKLELDAFFEASVAREEV